MKIVFGSDHAGFALRRILSSPSDRSGVMRFSEVGAQDEQPYDYPDAAAPRWRSAFRTAT